MHGIFIPACVHTYIHTCNYIYVCGVCVCVVYVIYHVTESEGRVSGPVDSSARVFCHPHPHQCILCIF